MHCFSEVTLSREVALCCFHCTVYTQKIRYWPHLFDHQQLHRASRVDLDLGKCDQSHSIANVIVTVGQAQPTILNHSTTNMECVTCATQLSGKNQ